MPRGRRRGSHHYHRRKNLDGDKIDVDKFWKPSLVPNISFKFRDATCLAPRAHPELAMTIQDPPGNNSNHPLENNSKGPYGKKFPAFLRECNTISLPRLTYGGFTCSLTMRI